MTASVSVLDLHSIASAAALTHYAGLPLLVVQTELILFHFHVLQPVAQRI